MTRICPLLLPLVVSLAFGGCSKVREAMTQIKSGGSEGAASAPSDLSEDEFDSFIATPDKVVVIDFHAEWCAPCKVIGPILAEVSADLGSDVMLGKVDIDDAPQLAERFGVSSIPDVRIYRDGVVVDQFVGTLPAEEVRRRLARQVAELPALGAFPDDEEAASLEGADSEAAEPPIQPMKKDWLPPGVERR